MLSVGECNLLWAQLLIEELSRLPIGLFAIAPGSRSSVLAVAAARQMRVKSVVHLDERGLGFFALGHAKATRKPSVVITTSGSAVANLYPAVVEASQDHIPLILLTADRPLEHSDTSSNQTLDQVKIFGSFVRWFFDIPSPSGDILLPFLLTTVDQAYHQTIFSANQGPVHLNCRFQEPLLPDPSFLVTCQALPGSLREWFGQESVYTQTRKLQIQHSPEEYEVLPSLLSDVSAGAIFVGGLTDLQEIESIQALSKCLKWPVFADISSQLKYEGSTLGTIPHYDLLGDVVENLKPQVILHLGGRILSKRLKDIIEQQSNTPYIHVQNTLERQDEFHRASNRFTGIVAFCEAAVKLLSSQETSPHLKRLRAESRQMDAQLSDQFGEKDAPLTELAIAYQLSQLVPSDQTLFIGNSMSIRNMQRVATFVKASPWIVVNRGVSGIDGLLATACGFARGSGRRITVFLGDLSALYDLNSFLLMARSSIPVILIIVNNDGGGIFTQLPISKWVDIVEPYFVAPHGLTFRSFAEGFGLLYADPTNIAEFSEAYCQAQVSTSSTVMECRVDRI
ncbi:MAG: 2-succinyl-5-enolpyruvyl-6-hydroxy-3-cyclohexene-1-carboxylic-acid synthase [Candidatus Margulisiibacteriota bacterium]